MPLYEYKCKECNHEFAEASKIDDREKPLHEKCPKCSCSGKIHRVYSSHSFVDPGILKADRNMEKSGVQKRLEEIRDYINPNMKWTG